MQLRFFAIILFLTAACGEENGAKNSNEINSSSMHPYASYFYAFDTIVKVYQYRDVVHGMNEQYHRVFGIEDSEGKHVADAVLVRERLVSCERLVIVEGARNRCALQKCSSAFGQAKCGRPD